MITLAELGHRANLSAALLEDWLDSAILSPGRAHRVNPVFTFEDVLIAALLAQLKERRLSKREIKIVSSLLYDSVRAADAIPVAIVDLPDVIFHSTIQWAEAEGRYTELAHTRGVDPHLRLFDSYEAYLEWLSLNGQAPEPHVLAAAKTLDSITLDLVQYYFELFDDSYLTGPGVTPLWDVVPSHGHVRILSRSRVDAVPWHIEDQTDLASFITVSIPVLARQVAARASAATSFQVAS